MSDLAALVDGMLLGTRTWPAVSPAHQGTYPVSHVMLVENSRLDLVGGRTLLAGDLVRRTLVSKDTLHASDEERGSLCR